MLRSSVALRVAPCRKSVWEIDCLLQKNSKASSNFQDPFRFKCIFTVNSLEILEHITSIVTDRERKASSLKGLDNESVV